MHVPPAVGLHWHVETLLVARQRGTRRHQEPEDNETRRRTHNPSAHPRPSGPDPRVSPVSSRANLCGSASATPERRRFSTEGPGLNQKLPTCNRHLGDFFDLYGSPGAIAAAAAVALAITCGCVAISTWR